MLLKISVEIQNVDGSGNEFNLSNEFCRMQAVRIPIRYFCYKRIPKEPTWISIDESKLPKVNRNIGKR